MRRGPWVILLYLGVSFYALGAEDEVFRHPLGAEDEPRFLEICGNLSRYPVIRGNFEQRRTIQRLRRALVSSGTFLISAGDGMVWQTMQPFPSTLILGRDSIVQTMPLGQKIRIPGTGNEAFLGFTEAIESVFSGNPGALQRRFDIYFQGEVSAWVLGLLPKEGAMRRAVQGILLSGGETIRSITLSQENGDTVRYVLSDQTFGETLSGEERAFFDL